MKAHDWFIEHRLDFVARALEPGDDRLFREHIARCEECRRATEATEHDLAWLPIGAGPVAPRPGFTRRVVQEVAHPTPAWRRWAGPTAAAAALILAAGLWRSGAGRAGQLEQALREANLALAATQDTLSVFRRAERILQASVEVDGRRGGLLIFADETTHRWKVVVHGIPRPAEGRYRFWFITADGMVHGAEIECDERTPAVLTLDMPEGARGIRGGALTLEPATGDPTKPRGRELAHLEL